MPSVTFGDRMAASEISPLDESALCRKDGGLWATAIGQLDPGQRQQIEVLSTGETGGIEDVLAAAQERKDICLKKRWKMKRKNGDEIYVRDILDNFTKWIQKFKEVGDQLVQYDPSHAAIPWAAVRLVLQAAVNEHQIHDGMLEGLEKVAILIARYVTVERLYLRKVSMERDRLKTAILRLYKSSLLFLLKAQRHFSKATSRKLAESIVLTSNMKIEPYLQAMEDEEMNIARSLQLIDAEYSQKIARSLEEGITNMSGKVDDIDTGVYAIRTKLDQVHENLNAKTKLGYEYRNLVFKWLSFVSTQDDLERAMSARLENTCDWFMQRSVYQDWLARNSSDQAQLLWIHGPLSSGKTILCAHIIEQIRGGVSEHVHIVDPAPNYLAYFFCSFANSTKQSPMAILRSWLAQLVAQDKGAFTRAAELMEECAIEATDSNMWHLFDEITAELDDYYLIVDGFDECADRRPDPNTHALSDGRMQFLEKLLKFSVNKRAHLLFVSRDDDEVRRKFCSLGSSVQYAEYAITKSDTKADIETFSGAVVDQRLTNKSPELKQSLAQEAAQRSDGMFIWIRLLHDHLHPAKNENQLRETIRTTPSGLFQSYEREVERILNLNKEEKERAILILRWVAFALRPLTVRELTEALHVSLHGNVSDFPLERLPDDYDESFADYWIKMPCGSFISFERDKHGGKVEAQTIHLRHYSMKEYLLTTTNVRFLKEFGPFAFDANDAHTTLAHTCVTFLCYGRLPGKQDTKISCEWYRECSGPNTSHRPSWFSNPACRGCCRNIAPATWTRDSGFLVYAVEACFEHLALALDSPELLEEQPFRISEGWRWLKLASPFGLPLHIAQTLFEYYTLFPEQSGTQLKRRLFRFWKPDGWIWLRWASLFASIKGIPQPGTPFYWAAYLGLTEIMNYIYLQRPMDAYGDSPYPSGILHALEAATLAGHVRAADFLIDLLRRLEYGSVTIKPIDSVGRFWDVLAHLGDILFGPRHYTARHVSRITISDLMVQASLTKGPKYEGLVFCYLKHGADLHNFYRGWTVLHSAASLGSQNFAQSLLERGLDVDCRLDNGETPLHVATSRGHSHVMDLLLHHGADASAYRLIKCGREERDEWTPLHIAAAYGHLAATRLLLDHGVNVNMVSKSLRWSALHVAAAAGHEKIVLLLLEKSAGALDINRQDVHKRTALHLAITGQGSSVVDLLLNRGAKVDMYDVDRNTPLHYAVGLDDTGEIMTNLVMHSTKCHIDATNRNGQTPLHLAFDQPVSAQRLLALGADRNPQDNNGRSPLWFAAENNQLAVLRLLIAKGARLCAPTGNETPLGGTALQRAYSRLARVPPNRSSERNDDLNEFDRRSALIECISDLESLQRG